VPLLENTGALVQPGEKTTVQLQKPSLTPGYSLCAVLKNVAQNRTLVTKEVVVTPAVALSPVAPAIAPVPAGYSWNVTLNTSTIAVGDSIAIQTGATAGSCAKGTNLPLVKDTGSTVRAGGTTTVQLQNPLSQGQIICAIMKNDAGVVTGTTGEVTVGPATAPPALVPAISPVPSGNDSNITVNTATAGVGDAITILTTKTAGSCAKGTAVPILANSNALVMKGGTTTVQLQSPLSPGQIICAITKNDAGVLTGTTPEVTVNPGCATKGKYSDCTFEYLLIGGIEQAGLSAQSSVTEGFYDSFLRRPVDSKWGSIWFRSRYLGTLSSSSTQNIVSATSNPSGALTAANLPQSVAAVDYVLGFQFDLKQSSAKRTTYSPIVGFGATSPLSATTTVAGYVVPAYGTNECNQLQSRFGTAQGYKPPLPTSGSYATSTGTAMGCVVQPNPLSTTTTPLPGTQITDIAFSNEDRSSFLLKWGAGVRIIDRVLPSGASSCSSTAGCSRIMADFTLGQDQAITGGYLRHLVFKADAIIPVFSTGAYFFASSANRLERNTTLSPLILSPVTVATSTSSSTCTASTTTVCFPSPSVFVLPYKQQNRDYYRIGVGIDIAKIFVKLFPAPATTTPATP
jgi:hypothetical protein